TTLLLFSVSLRRHQPPRSPLFPYTTLFRSRAVSLGSTTIISSARSCSPIKPKPNAWAIFPPPIKATRFGCVLIGASDTFDIYQRSEEHTSELQSRFDLVCRLLLEKKNDSHI